MPIGIKFHRPKKGGWGIHVCGVSGPEFEWLRDHNLIEGLDGKESRCNLRSERLKHAWTPEPLRRWIQRFRSLSPEEQLGKIAHKSLKKVTSDYIQVSVQYYQLWIHGRLVTTSAFVRDLERLGAFAQDYKLVPTVVRSWPVSRERWEGDEKKKDGLKYQMDTVAAKLKGEYKGFMGKPQMRIRNRVVGAKAVRAHRDAHQYTKEELDFIQQKYREYKAALNK